MLLKMKALMIMNYSNNNLKEKVQFRFSQTDRPNEVDETRGSCEKLKKIGWSPTITFEKGIKDIIESENL